MKLVTFGIALLAVRANAQLPKKVFGHYLVGSLSKSTNHAQLDVQSAKAIGFDAVALNLFDWPGAGNYAQSAVEQLFQQATTYNLKLFFSIDAGAQPNITKFIPTFNKYYNHSQYYTQYGKPMLSTFDTGGNTPDQWNTFLSALSAEPYFIPDFDNDSTWGATNGNSQNPAFFDKWGGLRGFSGAFGWDSAWPQAGTGHNETTAKDVAVIQTAHARQKAYMFPLSTFQFKHLTGANYWRVGQVNMPQRMTELLALDSNLPDFVEFITLNDGGEGHYISYVWPEGNGMYPYDKADHSGWQPLVTSFIQAYHNGQTASGMQPPTGSPGVGALWYLPILTSANCSNDPLRPPYGISSAENALNWAVVLPPNTSGEVHTYTAGSPLGAVVKIGPGLSYGSVPGVKIGAQRLEVWQGGKQVLAAASAYNVTSDNVSLCNFNYEVAPLKSV